MCAYLIKHCVVVVVVVVAFARTPSNQDSEHMMYGADNGASVAYVSPADVVCPPAFPPSRPFS